MDDMLLVPAGPFTMGADTGGEQDERPAHTVVLPAFWLDRTEVTNAMWDECVRASACRAKSAAVRNAHPDFNGARQPVTGVSWDDARDYCAWRAKRLPREAEFEKAVRDADGRRFAWGNDPPTRERTVYASGHPEDVGTHPAGRGRYGHEDLSGNVWEWLEDEYDPSNRAAALGFLQERQALGEIVTGLLFVDPTPSDLHDHLDTVDTPLNALTDAELTPGAAALAALNATLR